MPKPLIREVAEYCWSNNFLDVFREYFRTHGHLFEEAPEIQEGEHNLQFYALFQDYLRVYESTLTKYLESLNVDIVEFYAEIRQAKEETKDPYILVFIDCLLASTDYDSFYKVMVKEGKKSKLARNINSPKKTVDKFPSSRSDDAKADCKEVMRSAVSTKDEISLASSSSERDYKSDCK